LDRSPKSNLSPKGSTSRQLAEPPNKNSTSPKPTNERSYSPTNPTMSTISHGSGGGVSGRRHSASGPILLDWDTSKQKPALWERLIGKNDNETIKILHDDVEKQILQTVRRNSMKKDGLSEIDIENALKMVRCFL
jgi:hypothetical protein